MPAHVFLKVRCTSCRRPVELECKGLDGFWGYQSYNEYICPHCEKRNSQLCSGTIVGAQPAIAAGV